MSRRTTNDLGDANAGQPVGRGAVGRGSVFLRGLGIGALVGAAIAGSTLWERRRGRGIPVDAGHDVVDGAATGAAIGVATGDRTSGSTGAP